MKNGWLKTIFLQNKESNKTLHAYKTTALKTSVFIWLKTTCQIIVEFLHNLKLNIQVAWKNAHRPKKTFNVNKALKHLQQEIKAEIKHPTVRG